MLFRVALALALLVGMARAQDVPGPLDAALAEAEALGPMRFSVTLDYRFQDEPAVRLRYDAEADDWSVIDGDPGTLSAEAQRRLDAMKKETAPGQLLYADFRPYLENVRSAPEAEEGEPLYAFTPPEARQYGSAEEAAEVLKARLAIHPEGGHLARYEVQSRQSFKPLPVARLDEFYVLQRFERLDGDGPPVLVELVSRQKGDRMFRSVDVAFTARFSDHVAVP